MLFNHNLTELINIQNTVTIHVANLQTLMCEVYKSLHHDNPSFMWIIFNEKSVPYKLRNRNLLCLPETKTQRYGLNGLSFRAAILWNTLPYQYKEAKSIDSFCKEIRKWRAEKCTCKICRV